MADDFVRRGEFDARHGEYMARHEAIMTSIEKIDKAIGRLFGKFDRAQWFLATTCIGAVGSVIVGVVLLVLKGCS